MSRPASRPPTGTTARGADPRRRAVPGPRRVVGALAVAAVAAGGLSACGGDDPGPGDPSPATTRVGAAAPQALDAPRLRRAFARLDRVIAPGERVFAFDIGPLYAGGSDQIVVTLGTRTGGPGRRVRLDGPGTRAVRSVGSSDGVALADLDREAPGRLVGATLRGLGPTVHRRSPVGVSLATRPGTSWTAAVQDAPPNRQVWSGDAHGDHVLGGGEDHVPAPPEGRPGPGIAPSGLDATGLLRRANLRRALAAVRDTPGADGRVQTITVSAATDSVTVYLREGRRLRPYEVDAAFGVRRGQRFAFSDHDARALSSVDPGAPQRAIETIARRTHRPVREVAAGAYAKYVSEDAYGRKGPLWTVSIPREGHPDSDVTWSLANDGTSVRRTR